MAWAPIPWFLQLLIFIPLFGGPTFLVIAAGVRQLRGGSSDFELVDGSRSFSVSSVRFRDLAPAMAQALLWQRRFPMTRPAGTVLGNAADPGAIRDAPASLPTSIEVSATPLQIPSDAAGLQIKASTDSVSPSVVEHGRPQSGGRG